LDTLASPYFVKSLLLPFRFKIRTFLAFVLSGLNGGFLEIIQEDFNVRFSAQSCLFEMVGYRRLPKYYLCKDAKHRKAIGIVACVSYNSTLQDQFNITKKPPEFPRPALR
jgi:hypothetical protein